MITVVFHGYLCLNLKFNIMKKTLLILFVVLSVAVTSCSKDATINRRIDGDWKVVTIAGMAPVGESYTFSFNKDKKLTGNGTLTYSSAAGTVATTFTYTVADQKITLTETGVATPEVLSVSKYEKKHIELIDSQNYVWVLEPK